MVDEKDIDFDGIFFNSSGSALSSTGKIENYLKGLGGIFLNLSGHLGEEDFYWITGFSRIPEILMPRGPFDISSGDIVYEKGRLFSLSAEGKAAMDTRVAIDLKVAEGCVSIPVLSVKDEESDARFVYDERGEETTLAFSGRVIHKTLDRLLLNNRYLQGEISGDFSLLYDREKIGRSRASGTLQGFRVTLPLTSVDLDVNHFSIVSGERGFHVDKSEVGVLGTQALVQGEG